MKILLTVGLAVALTLPFFILASMTGNLYQAAVEHGCRCRGVRPGAHTKLHQGDADFMFGFAAVGTPMIGLGLAVFAVYRPPWALVVGLVPLPILLVETIRRELREQRIRRDPQWKTDQP